MTTISNRTAAVSVEYDGPAGRETKQFPDAYKARRFYVAKDNAGKHPSIKKAEDRMTATAIYNVDVIENGKKVTLMYQTKEQINKLRKDKQYKVLKTHKLPMTQEEQTASVIAVEENVPLAQAEAQIAQATAQPELGNGVPSAVAAKPKSLAEAFPPDPAPADASPRLQGTGDPTKTEVIESPVEEPEPTPTPAEDKAQVKARKAKKKLRRDQRKGKFLWVNENTKTITNIEWSKGTDGNYDRWLVSYDDGTQERVGRLGVVYSREHPDHHLQVWAQAHRDGLSNKQYELVLQKSREYAEATAKFYRASLKSFLASDSVQKDMDKPLKNKEEKLLSETELALARKLAELANYYVITVDQFFMLPGKLAKLKHAKLSREQLDEVLEKNGIKESECTIAVVQMATKLFRQMVPRLEIGGPQIGTPELAKAHEKVQAEKALKEPKGPKSEKAPKEPKPAQEKDAFGCKPTSQAGTINAAVLGAGDMGILKLEWLVKATKCTADRVKSHMKFLVAKGHVKAAKDGWVYGKTPKAAQAGEAPAKKVSAKAPKGKGKKAPAKAPAKKSKAKKAKGK